jgi:hypothetical protein
MPITRTALFVFAWIIILVLAGCASQPTPSSGEADQTVGGLIDQRLDQAGELLADNQFSDAEVVLSSIQFDQLNTAQRTLYAELRAELALGMGDGMEALEWLTGERAALFDGLPMERQIVISLMRSEAY